MIRFIPPNSPKWRRGLSLTELVFVLLVVGVVLGFLWIKVASVYENIGVMKTGKQLNQIVMAVHTLHPSDPISADENLDMLNLPSDMVGHFKGQTIIFNPWRGRVSLFPGNAIGDGYDKTNNEFTIRYDGVPSESCADIVMQSTSQEMSNLGLVAVYIATQDGKGKEICFAQDSVCQNIVTALIKSQIEAMCHEKSRMTVMFTFLSHQ